MRFMSNRAVKYRRLALATSDRADADLLLTLAEECDRGVLCSAELPRRPSGENEAPQVRFEWKLPDY